MATNKQNKYLHKYSKSFCYLIKRNNPNPNQNHGPLRKTGLNFILRESSWVARARVFPDRVFVFV